MKEVERGVIALGGCAVTDDDPTWWCDKDQYGWDGPDPYRALRQVFSPEQPAIGNEDSRAVR
jgi:hypothetical protein